MARAFQSLQSGLIIPQNRCVLNLLAGKRSIRPAADAVGGYCGDNRSWPGIKKTRSNSLGSLFLRMTDNLLISTKDLHFTGDKSHLPEIGQISRRFLPGK